MDHSSVEEKSAVCCCEGDKAEVESGNCCCGERKTVRSSEEKKELTIRINRIAGQLGGVKRMVEEDKYCEDVLVQLAAVDKAVRSLTALILTRHMHRCIVRDVQSGDVDALDGVAELFKRFI